MYKYNINIALNYKSMMKIYKFTKRALSGTVSRNSGSIIDCEISSETKL